MLPASFKRAFVLAGLLVLGIPPLDEPMGASQALAETVDSHAETESSERWHDKIDSEWGGYLRARGIASWPDENSFLRLFGDSTLHDRNTELRLKNRLFLGSWGYFETHYEALVVSGDTREKLQDLKRFFPAFLPEDLTPGEPIDDDRRLMDLTATVREGDSYYVNHRLDRLSLTVLPEWGAVRIGRQVVTWGNGFLFNPMDLFNPFEPTDIERDYKVGDDMVTVQARVGDMGDLQFLYVPRRDPNAGDVRWDQSSLAGKLHFPVGTTEFDLMAAGHYDDFVVGVGAAGYLGDAAWRMDATWTVVDDGQRRDEYLSLVANMDYSWVWWKKNFYGFIELFFNGLGEDDPAEAFSNPEVVDRLSRGDLFTLGRVFLAGTIQIEAHPLVNVFVTAINNLNDPSGIVQPRMIWDFAEDFQLTLGANLSYGGNGTEFGGFTLPGADVLSDSPDNAFVYVTYFF